MLAESIRTCSFHNDGVESGRSVGQTPQLARRATVPLIEDRRGTIRDHVPHRLNRVVYAHCRHLVPAYPVRTAFRQCMEDHSGTPWGREDAEVRPKRSVEEVRLQLLNHPRTAPDLDRVRSDPKEIIRQIGEPGHMTEVNVSNQDVIDRGLSLKGKGGSHGSRIEQQSVVNQQTGQWAAVGFTSITA